MSALYVSKYEAHISRRALDRLHRAGLPSWMWKVAVRGAVAAALVGSAAASEGVQYIEPTWAQVRPCSTPLSLARTHMPYGHLHALPDIEL